MQDWHPEDIKTEVRKQGISLSELGRQAGIASQALRHALRVPRAEAEHVIANALNVHPMEIWPSRYDANGVRKQPQPVDNYRVIPRFGKSS